MVCSTFPNVLVFIPGTSFLVLFLQLCLILDSKNTEDFINAKQDKNLQVEVTAVFIDCAPDNWEGVYSDNKASRFEREQLFKHNALQDCNKKLAVSVRMETEPYENSEDEYIPIDHVFDGVSKKRVRLLDPYVLRLNHERPLQAYKLRRIDTVSGILTKLDEERFRKKEIKNKRNRIQRDLYHETEKDEWSNNLESAAVLFTLDHDNPRRHSFSMKLEDLQPVVPMPASTTSSEHAQGPNDCGLRLYMEETSKSAEVLSSTFSRRKLASAITPSKVVSRKSTITTHARRRYNNRNFQTKVKTKVKREVYTHPNITTLTRDKRHEHNIVIEEVNSETPLWIENDLLHQNPDFNRLSQNVLQEPRLMTFNDNINRPSEYQPHLHSGIRERDLRNESNLLNPEKIKNAIYKNRNVDMHDEKPTLRTDVQENRYSEQFYNTKDRHKHKVNTKFSRDDKLDDINNFNCNEKNFDLYEISNPVLWYTVHLQLFEKLSTPDGKTVWSDLTNGDPVSISSNSPEWFGQGINIRYRPAEWIERNDFILTKTNFYLLMPTNDANFNTIDNNSSFIDNNAEYIVVPVEDVVRVENDVSDVKSHNYSDTTTSNTDWQRRRRVLIRVSRALLGGSRDGLRIISQGSDRYLILPHRLPHRAQIDLEARADENQLVRVGSSGRISTLVADSTQPTRTVLTLQATNTGLAAARFRMMIRDCGPELSGFLNENVKEGSIAGPIVLPPKHTRRLQLEIPIQIPLSVIHCSVALTNDDDESVAVRDVAIKRGDRCFCVWHCDCVCLSEDPKLLCREMTAARQTAAGLSIHERSRHARSIAYKDVVPVNMLCTVAGVLAILLFLGLIKASIGLAVSRVGTWGLHSMLQTPRKLEHYYEPTLYSRSVEYDDDGWPIHPDTRERTVRLLNRSMEFVLNVIFFVTVPCLIICDVVKHFVELVKKTVKRTENKETNDDSKQCYSTHDIQNPDLHSPRRKSRLRKWMTPQAENLSSDLWQKGSNFSSSHNYTLMRPLLHDEHYRDKVDELQSSCVDSEQDDTEYVLMQMQKSRESLARSQRKLNDPGPSTGRTQ